MAITLHDEWDFYQDVHEDARISVRLDMKLGEVVDGFAARFPHTLLLDIPHKETREHNLPTRESIEIVNKIEDALDNGGKDWYLTGVITGFGYSRFVFCGADAGRDEDELASHLLRNAPSTKKRARLLENDKLNFYKEVVYPDRYNRNWMRDMQVCQGMTAAGEAFEEERDVDFYAYFEGRDSAGRCAQRLEEHFAVRDIKETENGRWSIYFTRSMIPHMGAINDATGYLLGLVEDECGGEFDGWGCPVHKKE